MAQCDDSEYGPQGDFKSLGLDTSTHSNASFTVEKNDPLDIKFKAPKGVKFTSKLVNAEKEDEDLSTFVFSQRYEGYLHFIIHFPETASYKFQLFALPTDTKETSLPNVYNYLIKVNSANKAVYPFPKQYAQWKEGCSLVEPLVLNSNSSLTNVSFKINIPNGKAAAVVVNGKEWNHLELKDKSTSLFTGTFDLHKLRNTGAKVTVNANFDESSGSYPTLLEYKI